MKLAINLASRNRPQLLYDTVMRTASQIRNPDTVFMVSADADDQPTIDMMMPLDKLAGGPRLIEVDIRQREDTIAAKWNRVVENNPDADVYMLMCDDGPIITPGFDEAIIEAASIFPDGIGCVYNRLDNMSFPGIQAPTRRLVELMGDEIYVPLFPYWFVDHWLDDIARMTDRISYCDVEHDCDTNRPPTMEMREPGWWATFFDACYLRRREIARRIIDATDEPQWRKDLLHRNHPIVEQRSKIINDCVRGDRGLAAYAAKNAPDERYNRVRAAAVALLRDELLPALKADRSPPVAAPIQASMALARAARLDSIPSPSIVPDQVVTREASV
jgi:hypothetical protein